MDHVESHQIRAVRSKKRSNRKILKEKIHERIRWWQKFEDGRISIFSPLYEGSWKQLAEEDAR
eukprot:snap_masked-scaffold_41-processed-gene-2.39-mRNA-1 protein AED:1.00 eAED:1.00 QI:0/-1/0/0/-1/1/1/0/62